MEKWGSAHQLLPVQELFYYCLVAYFRIDIIQSEAILFSSSSNVSSIIYIFILFTIYYCKVIWVKLKLTWKVKMVLQFFSIALRVTSPHPAENLILR